MAREPSGPPLGIAEPQLLDGRRLLGRLGSSHADERSASSHARQHHRDPVRLLGVELGLPRLDVTPTTS